MRTPNSVVVGIVVTLISLPACHRGPAPVKDEAAQAGLSDDHFRHASEDYFKDMDNGVQLSPQEIEGRNMWLVWSGGNDRFWDSMSGPTLGGFDLLKIVAPDPNGPNRRDNRWHQLGLVNEPCFSAPTQPDQYGLWRDIRDPKCAPDPFASEQNYPGVKIGSRGRTVAVGSYYGEPTGIVGLRLFPNPAFDDKAKAHWMQNLGKYYSDPRFYNDRNLVRPYRVGMSCGFCHVGPSPIHPPKDPEHPAFADLNSTVGAQYMWVDRLFFWKPNEHNFMYQWVKTYRPGSMDTSLVSSDNINNPRTMNALYSLWARLGIGKRIGHETLAGGERNNMQFNMFVKSGPLTDFYKAPDTVWTPHVLKDGADSVGALGALNRVYINIGLYSEEWLRHFNPVAGGKPISPIAIEVARQNSAYWRATEKGTVNTALFFLKAAQPDRLADAPGGKAYLTASATQWQRGRDVFADTCARCHSSKQPRPPQGVGIRDGIGADYLKRFLGWWRWTQTPGFKQQMRAIAAQPDFAQDNYFSSDARIPVTLLRTNLCSPLASNAIANNIWDNFSSSSYKQLPSVGKVTVQDPFTGKVMIYSMPAGGRGYTRVPSLISLWSTAPFLLNNSVGPFNGDPSVAGRMKVFDASIQQMLWPERRERDRMTPNMLGLIDRTTSRSYFFVPTSFVPRIKDLADRDTARALDQLADKDGNIVIGPIPAGTPVGLLASLRPLAESQDKSVIAAHYARIVQLLVRLKASLITVPKGADDTALRAHFASLRLPLMKLSKCPDYVVNKGHYFGTAMFNSQSYLTADERSFGTEPVLSEPDKMALIAYLKTL
ncbi:MAG: c-type cytochrome [Sphingomonas sp.]